MGVALIWYYKGKQFVELFDYVFEADKFINDNRLDVFKPRIYVEVIS